MKATFIFSVCGLALAYGVWWYGSTANICPVPISYQVGEVDSRFGITKEEVKELMSRAETVWEEASGQDLFVYNETADFPVNLIYDERQKEASTEEAWRVSLDAKEDRTEEAFAQIDSLRLDYESKRQDYDADRERYESELASYNSEVEHINENGGASKEKFANLEAKKASINADLKNLLKQEGELNKAGEELNRLGEEANALVEIYNAEVVRYNNVYTERSEVFTQGDYERDRINVYTYSTKDELATVLAHELGHALGIGHVEGGDSLMYYLMADQPENLTLSPEDKEALITLCGDGTDTGQTIRRLIRETVAKFN
jgi:hypothetical protein